jgi:ankyrin repeat protein
MSKEKQIVNKTPVKTMGNFFYDLRGYNVLSKINSLVSSKESDIIIESAEIIKLIDDASGSNLNISGNDGLTAFMSLCRLHKEYPKVEAKNLPVEVQKMVKTFLNYMKDNTEKFDFDHVDNSGFSSLAWSLELRHSKAFKEFYKLFKEQKIDINAQDNFGATAFFWASIYSADYPQSKEEYYKIMDFLVQEGASIEIPLKSSSSLTPLFYNVTKGNLDASIKLLKMGADSDILLNGKTPLLHICVDYATNKAKSIYEPMLDKVVEFITILSTMSDFKAKFSGNGVYSWVSELMRPDALDKIHTKAYNQIDDVDSTGKTTAHWMLEYATNGNSTTNEKQIWKKMFEWFVEKGADLTKKVKYTNGDFSIKDLIMYPNYGDLKVIVDNYENNLSGDNNNDSDSE